VLAQKLGRGDQICGFTRSGRHVGRCLTQLAEEAGVSIAEFAYDLLIEEEGLQGFVFPWQVPAAEAEATVQATANHPLMMVASDGVFNVPHPHPRGTGCFARVLGDFVRQEERLSLVEAVYKMSGFPADRFRIRDRGRLAEGRGADLLVFDPRTVGARSTFDDPTQLPVGIDDVVVNGQPVISGGAPTDLLPGRVLGRQ